MKEKAHVYLNSKDKFPQENYEKNICKMISMKRRVVGVELDTHLVTLYNPLHPFLIIDLIFAINIINFNITKERELAGLLRNAPVI